MSNASKELLDLLLNDIEMNCDPTSDSEQCNRFSLECLALIQNKLPTIATEALSLINDYLAKRAQLSAVETMLSGLWQYLDLHHKGQADSTPEVSAIRAVIFPLYAQTNPELRNIVDHLSLFLEFVNNVEPLYDEQEALLRKHFSECLETK